MKDRLLILEGDATDRVQALETGSVQCAVTNYRRTTLSPCRKYRYTLWRDWSEQMEDDLVPCSGGASRQFQYLNVIGLNPSTADETKDDPTIRRCIDFAKRWGFGALCMTNLFAFRSTYPRDLLTAADSVGPDNLEHVFMCAKDAGMVLAAWGKSVPIIQQRADFTAGVLRAASIQLHALKVNKDGSPQHPLYVASATQPIAWPVSAGSSSQGVGVEREAQSDSLGGTLTPQGDFTRVLRRLPTELNNNLSVPVLAEPEQRTASGGSMEASNPRSGEARESTEITASPERELDSRSGQNNLSGGVESRHAPDDTFSPSRHGEPSGLAIGENARSGSSDPPAHNLLFQSEPLTPAHGSSRVSSVSREAQNEGVQS